ELRTRDRQPDAYSQTKRLSIQAGRVRVQSVDRKVSFEALVRSGLPYSVAQILSLGKREVCVFVPDFPSLVFLADESYMYNVDRTVQGATVSYADSRFSGKAGF